MGKGEMGRAVFDFSATTTVITGGVSGIGLACAELIARCGGDVVVSAHRRPDGGVDAAKVDSALERIRAAAGPAPSTVTALGCDVGDEASVAAFFRQVPHVDYLIHSAGVSPNTAFLDQTGHEWDTVHNVNTTGAFLVTKHAALAMERNPLQGDFRGRILLITSTNGINSQDPVSAHYDSSKAAANMVVRTAAERLAEMRICVNGLAPGWINTEMNATLPPDLRERESARIWMRRWADPEEVARCAAHLLTMPYLMGQVVMVDGGYR